MFPGHGDGGNDWPLMIPFLEDLRPETIEGLLVLAAPKPGLLSEQKFELYTRLPIKAGGLGGHVE